MPVAAQTTSGRLLETTAQDVMRHLANRDYADAIEEMLPLSSAAAIFVTAVVIEGMNPKIARKFVEEARGLLDLSDAMDHRAAIAAGEGAPRGRS